MEAVEKPYINLLGLVLYCFVWIFYLFLRRYEEFMTFLIKCLSNKKRLRVFANSYYRRWECSYTFF